MARLRRAGATVVLTPGNHDSARRLGTFSRAARRRRPARAAPRRRRLDEPVLLADEHGDVAIYGLPYLEPEVARFELGLPDARSHEAVLGEAMDRVRSDLFLRPGTRSVVLAHAFVGGGQPSESERDISVGGVDLVPAARLRRRRLRRPGPPAPPADPEHRGCATAARRWPTRSARPGQQKQAWLVDLDAGGLAGVRAVPLPTPRPLSVLTGTLEELLADPRHTAAEGHFVSARLTDAVRPTDPMRRLQGRFPHCVHLEWTGSPAVADAPQLPGAAARPQRHGGRRRVRRAACARCPPREAERSLLGPGARGGHLRGGRRVRLHSLSLTAFGPFPETVEVDLDEAGRDGLFLLWGPTGAGKTTLLDAVVFAFYGTVPGVRGEEKRLRSDHAGADVRTEVSCEVTLGPERLRVIRRPEQQRPKKRGEGWTTEQAKLTVQRWTGHDWAPVSTRIDEGSEYLRTRLGLSAEQFCQVVLLPQGDFARFLRAEQEDRGRLLRTLFDVGRFARVEDWLAGERAAARDRLVDVRQSMGNLLSRLAQVADVDIPEELAPELAGAEAGRGAARWVAELRASAAERLAGAVAAAEAAAAATAAADAEVSAARALEGRHAAPRARPGRPGDARRRSRSSSRRCASSGTRGAAPSRSATSWRRRAAPRWPPSRRPTRCAPPRRPGRRSPTAGRADTLLARELRDEVARLRALLPDVERANDLDRRLRRLDGAVAELTARCALAAAGAAAWPGRIAEHEAVVARAQDAAARLPGEQARRDAVHSALDAARAADALAGRLGDSRRDGRPAAGGVGRRPRAVGHAARAAAGRDGRRARRGAAARGPTVRYAERSSTRVRPPHDGPTVTAADEQAAREGVDAAEAAQRGRGAAVERQERELAALRGRAGDRTVAELQAAVGALDAAVRAIGTEAAWLSSARSGLAELAGRPRRGGRRAGRRPRGTPGPHGRVPGRCARRWKSSPRSSRRPAGTTRGLPSASHGSPPRPSGARRSSPPGPTRCGPGRLPPRPLAAAEQRTAEAGFADLLEAAGALLDAGRLAALDRRIDEHDRALAIAQAALAEPDLADLPPRPDLAALGERCAEATRRRDEAVAELDRARRCVDGLDALTGEATALQVELDQRRAEADQVGDLADLVNGRGANTLKHAAAVVRARRTAGAGGRGRQPPAAGHVRGSVHLPAQRRAGPARRPRRPGPRRPRRVHRLPARHQDAVRRGELHGVAGARARARRRGHRGVRRRADRHALRRRGLRHARRARPGRRHDGARRPPARWPHGGGDQSPGGAAHPHPDTDRGHRRPGGLPARRLSVGRGEAFPGGPALPPDHPVTRASEARPGRPPVPPGRRAPGRHWSGSRRRP